MKTTLIIMAAGIGSRFGAGIKQLAKMDDKGHIIMDYSIHDAVEAGFNEIVFVIRKDIEDEFKEVIGNRIEEELKPRNVSVKYVYQDINDIPKPFKVPEGRTKPWGTGQAILACKDAVKHPYVIINADDYYGKESFVKLHEWLTMHGSMKGCYEFAMAGFILKNTVSESGKVTRGLCESDSYNCLQNILETSGIYIEDDTMHCDDAKTEKRFTKDSLVSMNMWAGYPNFFEHLEEEFKMFLEDSENDPMKKEFLLPNIIQKMLKEEVAYVDIKKTNDKWIGITYQEDLENARKKFKDMIDQGIYSEDLFFF
jgi:hypothetical protein